MFLSKWQKSRWWHLGYILQWTCCSPWNKICSLFFSLERDLQKLQQSNKISKLGLSSGWNSPTKPQRLATFEQCNMKWSLTVPLNQKTLHRVLNLCTHVKSKYQIMELLYTVLGPILWKLLMFAWTQAYRVGNFAFYVPTPHSRIQQVESEIKSCLPG